MNTSKQVNLMVGLLFLLVLSLALYWIWDPIRAEEAEEKQTEKAAERGAELFATFCRTCHGNQGLGRSERSDLPGAPLNVPDNRPDPIKEALKLEKLHALFRDTIRCGRVGTLMPPWSLDQGGALIDEQIRQLVIFITTRQGTIPDSENPFGETTRAWQQALEFANHQDETGKHLVADVGARDNKITVSDSKGLKAGETGIIRLDNELLKTVSIDGNELTVERGLRGTKPADHAAGSAVYGPPIDPPTGPVNEQACGQFARGLPSSPAPAAAVRPDAQGMLTVEMGDNFFVQSRIEATSGQDVTVNLANNGRAIHNMRIAGVDGRYESGDDFVSNPDSMKGGAKGTLKFKTDRAGTYDFRCDFHATEMTGTIAVVAP